MPLKNTHLRQLLTTGLKPALLIGLQMDMLLDLDLITSFLELTYEPFSLLLSRILIDTGKPNTWIFNHTYILESLRSIFTLDIIKVNTCLIRRLYCIRHLQDQLFTPGEILRLTLVDLEFMRILIQQNFRFVRLSFRMNGKRKVLDSQHWAFNCNGEVLRPISLSFLQIWRIKLFSMEMILINGVF